MVGQFAWKTTTTTGATVVAQLAEPSAVAHWYLLLGDLRTVERECIGGSVSVPVADDTRWDEGQHRSRRGMRSTSIRIPYTAKDDYKSIGHRPSCTSHTRARARAHTRTARGQFLTCSRICLVHTQSRIETFYHFHTSKSRNRRLNLRPSLELQKSSDVAHGE